MPIEKQGLKELLRHKVQLYYQSEHSRKITKSEISMDHFEKMVDLH